MFAWEWLRRCPAYRSVWQRYRCDPEGQIAARIARRFALVALEDPAKDARTARPVWRSERDPYVVSADARSAAMSSDLFDILRLAPFAHVTVDSNDREHWLFSNGRWMLRLDIDEGTLLGGPTLLRFRVEGLASLPPCLRTLGDLVQLVAAPQFGVDPCATRRSERWIAELRTADALDQSASHRQIAKSLFGDIADSGWRRDNDAYRTRVQRLVRAARMRRCLPISPDWFAR